MNKYVLDASALLALINNEKGSDVVSKALPWSVMSAVNVSEVAAVLNLISMPPSKISALINSLIADIIEFNAEQAYIAAELRQQTKSKGLSLGDRACLTLGKLHNKIVLTADKAWLDCVPGVKVEIIR